MRRSIATAMRSVSHVHCLFTRTYRARARARHNRASAVPRSMQTLPTARCCIRSSKAVRHSWSRYTRPRGGRSSPREIRPSIVSMLARLASRSRAFHAPQKTPSTWCYRVGHRHRHLRPGRTAAQQPPALLLHSSCTPPALGTERRGGASRERRAAGYRHTVVSPRRPGRCVAAPPRRHAGLTTCCATRRSLSRARLSGRRGMAAWVGTRVRACVREYVRCRGLLDRCKEGDAYVPT